jgi:hypothetical protein
MKHAVKLVRDGYKIPIDAIATFLVIFGARVNIIISLLDLRLFVFII